jgi:HlyD family secretion protein
MEASKKKRLIMMMAAALLVIVGGLVFWGQHRRHIAERYYSGTIEADTANLAFQVEGRVGEVLVDEGQVLARLTQAEFKARRNQADADLVRARETARQLEAVLNLQRTGLPAEVDRTEAAVKALKFQLQELERGYRPQEVERARLAVEAARVAMDEARRNKDRFDKLYERRIVAQRDKEEKDLLFETAEKEYERAREAYAMAREGFRREEVETARARLAEGRAQLNQARSNLQRIEAAEREAAAAAAQVQAVAAALELAEIQLRYTELVAPFPGIITSRNVEPGEVVSTAREVISLADLSRVDLKIFVGETEIGNVKPGQRVSVKTDTFPDKTYSGTVSYISPEGEFTPKIIQTQKERVKLVYLVKVSIANPDLELKPGMPADAWLR